MAHAGGLRGHPLRYESTTPCLNCSVQLPRCGLGGGHHHYGICSAQRRRKGDTFHNREWRIAKTCYARCVTARRSWVDVQRRTALQCADAAPPAVPLPSPSINQPLDRPVYTGGGVADQAHSRARALACKQRCVEPFDLLDPRKMGASWPCCEATCCRAAWLRAVCKFQPRTPDAAHLVGIEQGVAQSGGRCLSRFADAGDLGDTAPPSL